MDWYLGREVEEPEVRTVSHCRRVDRDWMHEDVEEVLDSGADCHVLPLSYYSEAIGTRELPALSMVIRDAQGNPIETTETRANITFEMTKDNGRSVKVIDSAVSGNVGQPLFAVGKMWKVGWGIAPESPQSAYLTRGRLRVPIWFSRNSTVTEMKIYRTSTELKKESKVRKITLYDNFRDTTEENLWSEGGLSYQQEI